MKKTEKYKKRLIQIYLEKIVEAYQPGKVYLTGSAFKGGWSETSDFDFIVVNEMPINPDQIFGAVDIVPRKFATKEMLYNSIFFK